MDESEKADGVSNEEEFREIQRMKAKIYIQRSEVAFMANTVWGQLQIKTKVEKG